MKKVDLNITESEIKDNCKFPLDEFKFAMNEAGIKEGTNWSDSLQSTLIKTGFKKGVEETIKYIKNNPEVLGIKK